MKLSWNRSLLVIFKMLKLFVNTLTADDKYYLLNKDNLTEPTEMKLSKKKKLFFNFFQHFPNNDLIFDIVDKKMTLIGYVFRKLRTEKSVVRKVSKKAGFRRLFNKQHDKRSQTLSKSAQQQL